MIKTVKKACIFNPVITESGAWTGKDSPCSLPHFVDIVADEAIQTECLIKRRGKPMPSQFHAVLNSMGYGVVHELLYAASLPHQAKVRV